MPRRSWEESTTSSCSSVAVWMNSTAAASFSLAVSKATTSTSLSSSLNPSSFGQAVTFAAKVTGSSPTGTISFSDGGSQIGSAALSGSGIATFTTSSLTVGTHSITAAYAGDANNTASTSAALIQTVNVAADSVKLHELQVSTMPMVAQTSGQAITGAVDDAIGAGFNGNPGPISPNGSGFTYYFNADPPAQGAAASGQEGVHRFLAAPDGHRKSFDEEFAAFGYAGPVKAPPARPATPRDWLAWIDVRGTDFDRSTFGSDLKGTQVNAIAGLTRRLTPDFLVGGFGGYEHFNFSSQALSGQIKGDGCTTGAYLGWRLQQSLRFDIMGAWSGIGADGVAGWHQWGTLPLSACPVPAGPV